MIAENGKLSVRRFKLSEAIDIRLDFPGGIIYQVACKNKKVAFLSFGEINAPLYRLSIIKTT